MREQAKPSDELIPYTLPIDIIMGGKPVPAKTKVSLSQDRIDRIETAAKSAKKEI